MDRKLIDKQIQEEVSSLPNIAAHDVKGKYDLIQEIRKEIDDAMCHLDGLKMNLRHAIEEYNAALAMSLRKRIPHISVGLNNGQCSTSYRSTNLTCRPDIDKGIWHFEPNDHGRRFSRRNSHLLQLSNSIEPLVDAIAQYYTGRYRSIRA